MRFLKQSDRTAPRLSLILLDWSVRDSFHLLHYLREQSVERQAFEVVLVEYYDHVSTTIGDLADMVDTWVLLEMPGECIYHKHLMYNVGIALARGQVVTICDSDAMARESFLSTILACFDDDPHLVLHLDQFRNVRRDMYPFNYPSFEEVLREGCINNVAGKTKGILDLEDPMHSRNYGACMCARREDVIAIGGADEDISYLGHVCGPYDLTFRLMNWGRRMVWHTEEYLYHTWHPGSGGVNNYCGPHDGKNMSTTAFQALVTGRVLPLKENQAIGLLRRAEAPRCADDLLAALINPAYQEAFHRRHFLVEETGPEAQAQSVPYFYAEYHGFSVYLINGTFYALNGPPRDDFVPGRDRPGGGEEMEARSFMELQDAIDGHLPFLVDSVGRFNVVRLGQRHAVVPQSLGPVNFHLAEERDNPAIFYADSLAEAMEHVRAVVAAMGQASTPTSLGLGLARLRRLASRARRGLGRLVFRSGS